MLDFLSLPQTQGPLFKCFERERTGKLHHGAHENHVLGPRLESPPGVTGGVTAFLLTGAGPLVIRRSCGLVAMTILTVKP